MIKAFVSACVISGLCSLALAGELDDEKSVTNREIKGTIILRINTKTQETSFLKTETVMSSQQQAEKFVQSASFQKVPAANFRSELDNDGGTASWYFYDDYYNRSGGSGGYYGPGYGGGGYPGGGGGGGYPGYGNGGGGGYPGYGGGGGGGGYNGGYGGGGYGPYNPYCNWYGNSYNPYYGYNSGNYNYYYYGNCYWNSGYGCNRGGYR